MFKNYLTIAIRNLARHKVYTFINIIGLAIGLACSTLILLYLQREFSFDQYHSKADRIHYVFTERGSNGNWIGLYHTPAPVAPALEEEFPEVERATRFMHRSVFVHVEGKDPVQSHTMVVDQAFFDVFDFPLVQGDAQTYLQTPFPIVVTESFAHTLFGDENPIGKTIRLDAKFFDDDYTITGILKDAPETSSFKPDLMTTTQPQKEDTLLKRSWDFWGFGFTRTFVLLKQGASASALEKKLPAFVDRHLEDEFAKTRRYKMMPLAQYHFVGAHLMPTMESGNINDCYTLGAIGIFIVVVACINFMNLSTARSTRRMREVGMRKVVGAKRVQLVCQFLGESILLSLLALMISLGIAELTLPMLNGFMGINLSLNPSMLPALFLLSLVVGLLAGSYPAFFLSSFRPTSVLKVMPNTKGGHALMRKGLVVVQFAISMVLIAGTIIVSQQTEFMRSADMGFQKESLIRLPGLWQNAGEIKTQLLQHAGVRQVTSTHVRPFAIQDNNFSVSAPNSTNPIQMARLFVDHDFIETFQIPLLSGRNFMPQDLRTGKGPRNASYKVLLNEKAAKQLKVQPGELIDIRGNALEVVGIVKDFHNHSFHEATEPLIMLCAITDQVFFFVRIDTRNMHDVLAHIETVWKKLPGRPFIFSFLDEDIDLLYHQELRMRTLYVFSSGLAIASLGLLGLVAYTAEVRTKEIGIRKVLGATEASIVSLLTKEFLLLVGLASLLAWPIAYYTMGEWLQNFAYRIDLSPAYFIASTGVALVITLITIAYQALKAARANPIEALRYE